MHSVEIIGKKKGFKNFFDDMGQASILLDGLHTFDGRPIGESYGFEINDLNGTTVLQSQPEPAGRFWRGSHVMRSPDGEELARITYAGFLGLRCTIELRGETFKYPRGWKLVLPGATITRKPPRTARIEISDETSIMAYVGIAFYLWLRNEASP